jgi:hypothetical protein
MGTIYPRRYYDYEVLMQRTGGRTRFHVWRTCPDARCVDVGVFDSAPVRVAIGIPMVSMVVERVLVHRNGGTSTEAETIYVPAPAAMIAEPEFDPSEEIPF